MKTKTLVLALVAVIILGTALYIFSSSSQGKKTYADDSSPVMFFYSEECTFCQKQKLILEELATEGYRVKLMDVGLRTEYWAQYEISGTPTFLAANGDRQVGLTQAPELRVWLEAHGAKIVQQYV
ncbi:MAG: thioredoxin family protein [Candidatus Micrarchaeota archaeon]